MVSSCWLWRRYRELSPDFPPKDELVMRQDTSAPTPASVACVESLKGFEATAATAAAVESPGGH